MVLETVSFTMMTQVPVLMAFALTTNPVATVPSAVLLPYVTRFPQAFQAVADNVPEFVNASAARNTN
jgi:hypothetical protein